MRSRNSVYRVISIGLAISKRAMAYYGNVIFLAIVQNISLLRKDIRVKFDLIYSRLHRGITKFFQVMYPIV